MNSIAPPSRPVVLASSSPYRRALLGRLQLAFEVVVPNVDETPRAHEAAADTALRLARAKAQAVAALRPDALVIGSDQVASCAGMQIGKPGDHARALAQLQMMRGQTVEFHTALYVIDAPSGASREAVVPTQVRFRQLSDAALDAYLRAEQPYDVAGSAKSEGLGIALLEAVTSDDPTALVGLPLIALVGMLNEFSVGGFA
ncbi:MAG: Maf family nucleotide pyrophosphatase [Janthinobacterium lividum]